MIGKLLVANRGEIAVRIIRAARELGVSTVAVYSDADEGSMHARLAEEAAPLGAPEPIQSYLNGDKIIRIARDLGCDAIHPGYGFLAESAAFAAEVEKAGLVWVGPPASAMRRLGSKIDAKALAESLGVPLTPGCFRPDASAADLRRGAEKLGFPVVLKASAGGGGRGMRVVRNPSDFERHLELASAEAVSAFGDGAMLVEKLIERPRHVEVQTLADGFGSVAALYERECSIQRRHQKLIEESPAPALRGDRIGMWPALRDAAVALVKASGYRNAGTVEFMIDEQANAFYFLEVNARLQVEHPVTEMVTGLDLVKWQLRIAAGEPLCLPEGIMEGRRSALHGHAIEARIVAEDPARGFAPSTGRIVGWAPPTAPGVRVDSGFAEGVEVLPHYDSLLAKVIAHGETRPEAIERLRLALLDFHVLGVSTNIGWLIDVLSRVAFGEGRFDTGYVERELPDWRPPEPDLAALGAVIRSASGESRTGSGPAASLPRMWAASDGFRVAGSSSGTGRQSVDT